MRDERQDLIERAREWLSQGLRAADPEVHCGEQLTEARILVDDLLAYVEAAPQDARTPLPPEVLAELEEAAKPHAGARPNDYATTEALHQAAAHKRLNAINAVLALPHLRPDDEARLPREVGIDEQWAADRDYMLARLTATLSDLADALREHQERE